MSRIPLHRERGLDPHLTFCPRCGGDTDELTIGAITVAHPPGQRDKIIAVWNTGQGTATARALREHGIAYETRPADDRERLPGTQPCAACREEMEQHRQIVAEGGVYFRCQECGGHGVVKADAALSKAVREQAGIEPPDPVGIEFETCAQHTPDEEH